MPAENLRLDQELWKILKSVDFVSRYYFYQELLCRGYLANLTMLNRLIELHPRVLKWPKSLCTERDQIDTM